MARVKASLSPGASGPVELGGVQDAGQLVPGSQANKGQDGEPAEASCLSLSIPGGAERQAMNKTSALSRFGQPN